MFLTSGKNISEQQNLFPQHVSLAAKLGNICVRNNVSATMFPSLARPLVAQLIASVSTPARA